MHFWCKHQTAFVVTTNSFLFNAFSVQFIFPLLYFAHIIQIFVFGTCLYFENKTCSLYTSVHEAKLSKEVQRQQTNSEGGTKAWYRIKLFVNKL